MKSNFKQGTVVDMIAGIQKDPMKFFRRVSAVAIEPDHRLYGTTWIQFFNKEETENTTQMPVQATYLQKFVITTNEQNGVDGFIQATAPIGNEIPTIIMGSINPARLKTPKDGHLRWQAGVPSNNGVYGCANIGSTIYEVNPLPYINCNGTPPTIVDIQCVKYPTGTFNFHTLLSNGDIYVSNINSRDTESNNRQPNYYRLDCQNKVNSLLTLPNARSEIVTFFGTDNGITTNHGDLILGTESLKIANISADSEASRIYFRTMDGDIYAMKYNENGSVVVRPISLGNIGNYQWMLGGPTVKANYDLDGILLSGWTKTADERHFIHTTRVVPIPAGIF